MIKEIREEYSATPIAIEFMGYRDVFRTLSDNSPTHWLALDFAAQVNRQDVNINEPDMFEDSGWFTIDTLPSPLHSQTLKTSKTNEDIMKRILVR